MAQAVTLLPIVEDNKTLEVIKRLAVEAGLILLTQDAVQTADLILFDDATKHKRNDFSPVSALLLTSENNHDYVEQQLKQGFDDFLFTPLNEALIGQQLRQHKALIEQHNQVQQFQRQTLKLREMGELIGLISHEVASPLGNVNTAISFLLESSERVRASFDNKTLAANELDKFLKQMSKALNMCIKNAGNAGGIISSFRSVAGNQCLEKVGQFYVHRYIDEIVLTLKSKLKKLPHEIHVVISESVDLTADPGAFSQVISGLINKSLMYGLDDNVPGQIIINGAIEKLNDIDTLVLNYIDNGKGMPESVVNTILSDNQGGNGQYLTTAMLSKIVEQQLHGTMEVESTAGKGVHYTLRIPQHVDAS